MSGRIDAERILDAFLAPEPDRLSDRVLEAALADVARTPQRRALRVPWRFPLMPVLSRATAVAAVALVAAVGAGGLIYVSSSSPFGRPTPSPAQPTAAPTVEATLVPSAGAAASPAASPAAWKTYTSAVYGLELEYPGDWTVIHTATRRWDAALDSTAGFSSQALDTFGNPEGSAVVSVWQVPAGVGADPNSAAWLAGWAEDLCRLTENEPCDGIPDRLVPMCRERADCHPAAIVPFEADVFAYVPVDDQVTLVVVWQPDTDPSVRPYGGGIKLLQDFLEPMGVFVPGSR